MIYLLISITLLAAMSPGPDFIVVMKNAIYWKKQWYFTALGVACAIMIHISYCALWIGIIISQSIILFQIIKILWALYLLYLSYQLLKSKPEQETKSIKVTSLDISRAFRQWFLTNVMNPKATLFFLSVFTQVISPGTTIVSQFLYGWVMALTAGIWFSVLTTIINLKYIMKNISKIQNYLNKIFWVFLAFIWFKILLQK